MKIIIISCLLFLSSVNVYSKHPTEFTDSELKGKNISLFGSFNCYDEFIKAMNYFESRGATILCPIRSKIIDQNADFKLFKDDNLENKTEKELQQVVFDKTKLKADIVYVVNNDCEIGLGTASEIGYVLALNDLRGIKKLKSIVR